MNSKITAFIVEPNLNMELPYKQLPNKWQLSKVNTIEKALVYLINSSPDVVFISASFSITKTIRLLESLKNLSSQQLIPIILVVDLSNKISYIPGTSWGGRVGIIHSLSSKQEINSTLNRVLSI